MQSAIDHLVVTAPTLAAGAAYIRSKLGVELEGMHAQAERIWSALRVLHFHGPFTVSRGRPGDAPRISASIETPHGLRPL